MRQSQNPDSLPGVHYRGPAIAALQKLRYMTEHPNKKASADKAEAFLNGNCHLVSFA
ncbi:hypothetical protein [Adhaeribacter arboris]|uniref:hypothetical protein n=1 Tax=Adhaeribacter arboris TaxID=2072846 RepID=UPI0013049EDF|nr:hypothetical protein [Adhaeribacter arboris]